MNPATPAWIIALRCVWVAACMAILARCHFSPQCTPSDAVYPVLALGFPTSMALVVVGAGVSIVFGDSHITQREMAFLCWMLASGAGYLQWFVLLPMVIRDHKRYHARRREEKAAQEAAGLPPDEA